MERNTDDLISIIIPVYNAESTLDVCIQSITSQSWQNLEILLVDDGSEDRSLHISREWELKDSRIRVFHQMNKGVSVARNLGMKEASGKWIAFVDSDDALLAGCLEIMAGEETGEEDIICCSPLVESGGKEMGEDHFLDGDALLQGGCKQILFRELVNPQCMQPLCRFIDIGVPWAKLYRRSFLEEQGLLFDPSLRRNQDNIFNIHAFYRARSVRYLDRPLYLYNIRHFSTFNRRMPIEFTLHFLEAQRSTLLQYGLMNDPVIRKEWCTCSCRRFLEQVKRTKEEKMTEAVHHMRMMRNLESFSFIMENGPEFRMLSLSWKEKVICSLIRHRCFRMLYFIWSLHHRI